MILKECLAIENNCYKKNEKMDGGKPKGIVVHSTGAANKTLKRYVQPVKGQKNYDAIIADLGKNTYGNHWNQPTPGGKAICCHAFIGVNATGTVETYQILPWTVCCWNCASGNKGSYNFNPTAYMQFEICEDNLKDEAYFNKAMKEAQELCAYICKKFNIPVDKIVSHHEAHLQGYASNHGDPENWLSKFGKDMKWFRKQVQALIDADKKKEEASKPASTKPTTTTTVSTVPSAPVKSETTTYGTTGQTLILNNTNLYSSAATKIASGKVTGTYYIWSNIIIDGRIRITNAKKNVGKSKQVTGWIEVKNMGGTATTTVSNFTIQKGSKIKLKEGAKYTNGANVPEWVRKRTCYVRSIGKDGTVTFSILKIGPVTGVVDKKWIIGA